ncbi:hypothetical protein VTJ04DRAFT_8341 [Mycothermus thermophilus]|uniref:uncharacterized protein n=1 Tax=Humicola insolens TaxID=85995 RepID=UPI00374402FE
MPNVVTFGDLLVSMTTEFEHRWSSLGTTASRRGAFWHPKVNGGLRPLGDLVVDRIGDINNNFATLLVGNASDSSAVQDPVRYELLWNSEGAIGVNAELSIWQPIPPDGYVALGCVASIGNHTSPSVKDIWCVRSDLVNQGWFEPKSTWDDRDYNAKVNGSFWQIICPSDHADAAKSARVLALPVKTQVLRNSLSPPAPPFKAPVCPGSVYSEDVATITVVPFTVFFEPDDRRFLDNISHPFVEIVKYHAWIFHDTWTNLKQRTTKETEIESGVANLRPHGWAPLMLDQKGFTVGRYHFNINKQLLIDPNHLQYSKTTYGVDVRKETQVIVWTARVRVEVKRHGTNDRFDVETPPFILSTGPIIWQHKLDS